ncbi:MAG TPA: hypothetical protein VFX02_13365 [Gammaproteobacteria bacterium]|nr:hypothetical protein [Gammaproteobacteria bacterium]
MRTLLHLAFASANPKKDKNQLIKVGVNFIDECRFDDRSILVMLRDPWGVRHPTLQARQADVKVAKVFDCSLLSVFL